MLQAVTSCGPLCHCSAATHCLLLTEQPSIPPDPVDSGFGQWTVGDLGLQLIQAEAEGYKDSLSSWGPSPASQRGPVLRSRSSSNLDRG